MGALTPPRPLRAEDDRDGFDCGRDSLNQWLRLGGIAAFDYSQALELLNFFGPELREVVERQPRGEPAG